MSTLCFFFYSFYMYTISPERARLARRPLFPPAAPAPSGSSADSNAAESPREPLRLQSGKARRKPPRPTDVGAWGAARLSDRVLSLMPRGAARTPTHRSKAATPAEQEEPQVSVQEPNQVRPDFAFCPCRRRRDHALCHAGLYHL